MEANLVKQARDMATIYSVNMSAADTSGQIVVQHIPSRGTGATAATLEVVTATSFTFQVGGTNPAGADAIGNSSGVVAFSTYTTMGTLVDYINSKQAYRAYLTGAIRADASAAKLLVKGATDVMGANGLTVFADTSAAEHADVTFSGEKFVNNGIGGYVTDWLDQCENKLVNCTINYNMASDGTVTFYSGRQGFTETIIYGPVTLTDNSALTKGLDLVDGVFFKAATRGQRLIIRAAHATDIGTHTTFNATGRTAVLTGGRVVVEDTNP